jgi:lysophospholipid acyltransferase (LPLAT)-like uncharacterized protein
MSDQPTPLPPQPPPRAARRASGVVVPNQPNWHQRLTGWCIFAALKIVAATIRFRCEDRTGGDVLRRGPALFCIWHNRLALVVAVYDRFLRGRAPDIAGAGALVSASKDGALLTGILQPMGVHVIRGSSSRRGPQALVELAHWARKGYDLAITPDGPRGPCYSIQDGIMSLAQVTGLPIVPGSFYLSSKISLKSWDRFQIPLPFARCDVTLGPPIFVPRDATDPQRDELKRQLQATMLSISRD